MPKRESNQHKNPVYLYEEGRGGGGPDSTSASSVSIRSSAKMIRTQLKNHGNKRWMLLAVVVLAVVIIIGTVLGVYFSQSGETEVPLTLVDSAKNTGDDKPTSAQASDQPTKSLASTTPKRPPTTLKNNHVTPDSKQETTPPPETAPTTTVPDLSMPSRLLATMSDVLYQPDDVKTLTLTCKGQHSGSWNRLTIKRKFKDSYEALGTVMNQAGSTPSVIIFPKNVTSVVDVKRYEVTLMLTFEEFECVDLTNFTCALETNAGTAIVESKITIFLPGPQLTLPHSIVEDRPVTLTCLVESWEADTNIVWKFRMAETEAFMSFSVKPVTTVTQKNCTQVVHSSLSFTPSLFEHGADFRCEMTSTWRHPQVSQSTFSEAKFNVLSSDFCEGKRQSSIYPHPHGECTVVVYCVNSGPLVYEVECDPGQCYDATKTACVPS